MVFVHDNRRAPVIPPRWRIDTARWLGALDALAPYLIAVTAIASARHSFSSPATPLASIALAAIALSVGTIWAFFRDTSPAHITWAITLAELVIVVPLIVVHVYSERSALDAPVPIHLLPLVFTWTAQFVAVCVLIGVVFVTCADQPGWAGIAVLPISLLIGAIPLLSTDLSTHAIWTTALFVFAYAEVVMGIGWLIPERRRWWLTPVVLACGAIVIARAFLTTPHHFPGRALLLIDAALAIFAGLAALAAPLLCRWLAGSKRFR